MGAAAGDVPDHTKDKADAADAVKGSLPTLSDYYSACLWRLRHARHQWAFALIASLAGLLMVYDGEASFKFLVVALVGILSFYAGTMEFPEVWTKTTPFWTEIASAEVAIVMAYAVKEGYQGVKVIMGIALGAFLGYKAHMCALQHGIPVKSSFLVVFYSICVIFGIAMFTSTIKKRFLGIFSPLVGGALLASAIGFACVFLFDYEAHAQQDYRYIDILGMLLGLIPVPEGMPKDRFKSFQAPVLGTFTVHSDRILGLAMWLGLFVLGYVIHNRRLKEEKRASMRANKQSNRWLWRMSEREEANARENLVQPLLI